MATVTIGRTTHSAEQMAAGLDYSVRIDKTLVDENGVLMKGAIEYSTNAAKTLYQGEMLVTGINCNRDTAYETWMQTKQRFNKTNGRMSYTFFQSFAEGEVDPRVAHEIGLKWATEMFPEFEVIVSTHLDTDNIHNDIRVNSVSFVDGHKYDNPKSDLWKGREINDRLCEEYGLSIPEKGQRRAPGAYFGKPSHYQILAADIERCLQSAATVGEVYTLLENMGYEVDLYGQHPKAKLPGWKNPLRIDSGKLGYTHEVLQDRIQNPDRGPGGPLFQRTAQKSYRPVSPRRFPRRKLTRFQALYIHYLHVLGKIKPVAQHRRAGTEDYRRFQEYKKQLNFVVKHNLATQSDVQEMLVKVGKQIKSLDTERFKLYGAKKKNKALFAAHAVYERFHRVEKALTLEERGRYREVRRVMARAGYKDCPEKVAAQRNSLMEAITQAKAKIQLLKAAQKMLMNILGEAPKIQHELSKEEKDYGRTVHAREAVRDRSKGWER